MPILNSLALSGSKYPGLLSVIHSASVFGGVGRRGVFEKFQNFPDNWHRIKTRHMKSTKKALWITCVSSCFVLSSLEYYDFFFLFFQSFMRSSSHTIQFTPSQNTVSAGVFSIFTELYDRHHSLDLFITPKRNPFPVTLHFSIHCPPQQPELMANHF